jgi:hypothetical protein
VTDLRDRIAAVLADADGMSWGYWSKPSQDGYLLRADAVIEALPDYLWRCPKCGKGMEQR